MGFPANLKRYRKLAELTQEQLAHACGWSGQSRIANYEAGKREPTFADADALARALGVSREELLGGKPRKVSEGWADVLGYAQAVGLGSGPEAQEYAETHSLKFKSASLARQRLNASSLRVMYGAGDSMLPRIHPGDAILFDTTDTRPRDGAIFVIQVHGVAGREYQAKRCMVLDDAVYFAADNPAGDHQWRKPKRVDAKKAPIEIVGRVRWIGSWEG